MREPRMKAYSRYVVPEESARIARAPRSQLTYLLDRMLCDLLEHEELSRTIDGAYEIRLEVVPVDEPPYRVPDA